MVKLDFNRMLLAYILNTNIKRPPLSLEAPAKVSGWWDGQHSGNQRKLKKYPPLNPPPPKLKRKKSLSPFWPDLYPSQVQFFFIEFDWPRQKKLKLWKLTKIEDSVDRWSASPFGSPIYVRRGGLWAKHMGLICASDDCFVLFFDRAWHGSPWYWVFKDGPCPDCSGPRHMM